LFLDDRFVLFDFRIIPVVVVELLADAVFAGFVNIKNLGDKE
jgi:hypothetical protein